MFGSNTLKFRAFKTRCGIEGLELPDYAREALMGGNAIEFLGSEQGW